ncbi:MAG: P-II family nitrogen regulator [Collinsella sp.]|uniref:P-II family nitrogen regulator n=1 Tax=Collinsella sp. TaxID=1965294 RepID=UPI0039905DA7
MKKLTAVVRQEKLEVLKRALFDKGIRGMTISQVQGCGNQHGWKEYVRGTEVLLNTIPKVEFEIVVDDEQVNDLVQVVCDAARTGEVGDGKIFVTPVEDVIRIRTGEHGPAAL